MKKCDFHCVFRKICGIYAAYMPHNTALVKFVYFSKFCKIVFVYIAQNVDFVHFRVFPDLLDILTSKIAKKAYYT